MIENDVYCATTALSLMQKYDVPPVPDNYTVWFHYASGKNKPLMHEIDNVVKNKAAFSPATCAYLHNKFITAAHPQETVDRAAGEAQKVLVDVLKVIQEFSGETQSYNKGVDDYLDNISQKFEDSSVQAIVKDLIGATATLKQQGEKINQKLEASTNEINALKQSLQQVTVESQHDFLTNTFNRKTFEKYADEQLADAKLNNIPLCLLMIDIDHFKKFNDRFGHLMGDEVLKIVARTLINILKGRDMVARFGGEEFIVILPETPIDGARKVAEMVRTSIADKQLKRKDTGESFGTITVSIGVGVYRPESDTLPTLIERADEAMYVSKNNGRNRVTCES